MIPIHIVLFILFFVVTAFCQGIDNTDSREVIGSNFKEAVTLAAEKANPGDLIRSKKVFKSKPASADLSINTFIGTWLSSGNDSDCLNVTELRADRTFHMDRYLGVDLVGTIDGRWQLTGDIMSWIYDDPPSVKDDKNPIVSADLDQFSLRETKGTITTFFRKGISDKKASQYLPISIGSGWVLKDNMGEVAIRISVRERFAGQDCYRVDWIDEVVYQSEYWMVTDEGIIVIGRRVMNQDVQFVKPYLLLKHKLTPGDSWETSVSFGSINELVKFVVGPEEDISTPAGQFRAIPVLMHSRAVEYKRWYAKDIGLVREDSRFSGNFHVNEKRLGRRIE
jgi:hypothetical protein